MTIKALFKTLAAGLILVTAISCGGNKSLIDTKALLAYGKEPNEQNMDVLSKSYSSFINKNRKTNQKNPGIYSDYAVMLVKQGKRAEANGYFNKEMEAFPSSRSYVLQLKRKLIPEYQDDNSTSAADADTNAAAEPDALTPAQRKKAEARAASVLGDTTDSAIETETVEPVGEETPNGNSESTATEQSNDAIIPDDTPVDETPEKEEPPADVPDNETEIKQ